MTQRPLVALISDADDPRKAAFVQAENGKRLLFASQEEAEAWLAEHAKPGVDYRLFDGTD
ncbi:hypothetical protein GPA22_22120 [Aromatoleum toluvorans]|uniref:Uncharacterized protein n=1 Tax=Aromatoleum toluvorans TaxID=92002 RepID=A0ABX1Q4Z7_9RHOO|nr:hypothetical protein [Aromatoleum toluvorans]NMG46418.1 hypothetical protein [Aromatoleum toluvorans]